MLKTKHKHDHKTERDVSYLSISLSLMYRYSAHSIFGNHGVLRQCALPCVITEARQESISWWAPLQPAPICLVVFYCCCWFVGLLFFFCSWKLIIYFYNTPMIDNKTLWIHVNRKLRHSELGNRTQYKIYMIGQYENPSAFSIKLSFNFFLKSCLFCFSLFFKVLGVANIFTTKFRFVLC